MQNIKKLIAEAVARCAANAFPGSVLTAEDAAAFIKAEQSAMNGPVILEK